MTLSVFDSLSRAMGQARYVELLREQILTCCYESEMEDRAGGLLYADHRPLSQMDPGHFKVLRGCALTVAYRPGAVQFTPCINTDIYHMENMQNFNYTH